MYNVYLLCNRQGQHRKHICNDFYEEPSEASKRISCLGSNLNPVQIGGLADWSESKRLTLLGVLSLSAKKSSSDMRSSLISGMTRGELDGG